MIYLLIILVTGAPSMLIGDAYSNFAECDKIARSMNGDYIRAVCQSVPIDTRPQLQCKGIACVYVPID